MFEKEAKEYVMREDVITENDRVPFDNGYGFQIVSFENEVKKGFQDGAEFGYNKAKEEMQEQGLALQSDMDKTIEQNIALKNELNKANEWHYVKEGDLPKEFDKPYLCYVNGHFEVGYFMAYKEQPWHFDEYYLDNEDVDAWKEIVLSKELRNV